VKLRDDVRWKWVTFYVIVLLVLTTYLLLAPIEYLMSAGYRSRGATFAGMMALFGEYAARYLSGLPTFALSAYALVDELFAPEETSAPPSLGCLRGRPSRVKRKTAEQLRLSLESAEASKLESTKS
jgi:hypothetical protein